MTPEKAIALLDEMTDADPELAHGLADDILCDVLREVGQKEVAEAFDRAMCRVGFWYA